jgi:hypothetical protein
VTWLFWLILVALVVAIVAVTGAQPKEGRRVAGTQLMGVARIVLVVVALIIAYFVYQANGAR